MSVVRMQAERRAMARLLGIVLGFVVAMPCASAQTGAIDPTQEELDGLEPFIPAEIELIEQPAVDLRPWVPKVGTQRMQDCVAWAVVYAAKSYVEARDQGWKPDAPNRIFSPRFVYNQINGGRDAGSNFIRAIRLMAEHGAATLATAPYRPGDYKTQPDARQKIEASAFPVHDAILIENRTAIRRALQRREIVVFGAEIGPTFFSGSFDRYTREAFVRDMQRRGPNQRHGKHAMVIVGYDDERGCFLVQNSWGTDWGWRGYAWVAYELFDEIRIDPAGGVFCRWAVTLVDVEEPVEIGSDGVPRPKPLDLSTLGIHGYSDIVRYDAATKKYVYVFTAELRGQRAALAEVSNVRWSWPDHNGKPRSFTSSTASMRFAVQAGTVRNPLPLEAVISFVDGSKRTVLAEIIGPNPKADFRDATIWFSDEYFGRAGDEPIWEYAANLDYPLEQRMDIVKVEWESMSDTVRGTYVSDGFNGPPADEGLTGRAMGPLNVRARIHYNDGGIKTVDARFEPRDEIDDGYSLETDSHGIGPTPEGGSRHSVRLAIDYPRSERLEIETVEYVVDPHMSPTPLVGYQLWRGFEAFAETHRDFRVRATIRFANGSTRQLEQWVELGDDTRYPTSERLELRNTDRYIGPYTGGAPFLVRHELIGDRAALERVRAVRFIRDASIPNLQGARIEDPNKSFWFEVALSKSPVDVKAIVEFEDGTTKTIEQRHERQATSNDVIGLSVDVEPRGELEVLQDPDLLYSLDVAIAAPETYLDRYHSVDWLHTVRTRRERTENRTSRFRIPSVTRFTTSFDRAFELAAYAVDIEGYGELIRADVTPAKSGDLRPPIALRVREKFWNYDANGRPTWLVRAEVVRDLGEYPAAIRDVEITSIGADGTRYAPTRSTSSVKEMLVLGPSRFEATVTFEDERTVQLQGEAPAWCQRIGDRLDVRCYLMGSSEDPMAAIIVEGWEQLRRSIRSVSYDFEGDARDVTRTYPAAPPLPSAEVYDRRGRATETATVTIRLESGETLVRTVEIPGERPAVRGRAEVRHWSGDEWETTLVPVGDWIDLAPRDYWHASFDHYFTDHVHAWPPGVERVRTRAGTLRVTPRPAVDGQRVETASVEVGPRDAAAPSDELRLRIERPPAAIARHAPHEWTVSVEGPEAQMIEIERVRYLYTFRDDDRAVEIDERYGELREGFEMRLFAADRPDVRAIVTFTDGRRQVLP